MTGPGDLNRRLVIEEPVETPDGAGGMTRSYEAAATVWASVVPLSARHAIEAMGQGATVTHRIVLRHREDLTTRHRLRDGSRLFRIDTLRDADGRRRYLEIRAEERAD